MASITSRRSVLAALAAAPVATAGAAPALTSRDDAELFAAIERFREANRLLDMALDAEDEAMGRYDPPGFPDALWVRAADCELVVPKGYSGDSGERRYFQEVTVEYLREVPCVRLIRHEVDGVVRHAREPWPEAQARADEIVGAWDAWQAETQKRRDQCGLTAAGAALDEARKAYRQACDALQRAQVHTIDGALAKAAAVMECLYSDEEVYADELELAGLGPSLALSLTRDLQRLRAAS